MRGLGNRIFRMGYWGWMICLSLAWAQAHHVSHHASAKASASSMGPVSTGHTKAGVSGQGKMKFRVLHTSALLPTQAVEVLKSAHGGFAVDRREGKGQVYFALPGAGILRVESDLKSARLVPTPGPVADANLHNTTIWYGSDGTPYLSFPSNKTGQVFTTTLDGALLHTLESPTGEEDFDQPTVNTYFAGQGPFVPTDVEELDGWLYVTTGYSKLDYVLTARILQTRPFKVRWHQLAFGGKGTGVGQFGTAHGITVPKGKKRIDISDRPNSEIERFTRYGHFRERVQLPPGSLPCDIDYWGPYAVVGCLRGPDSGKGAPIYILEHDQVISTIMAKEDLGLEKFTHIHNAILHHINGKFYILAQAWNPGDFAIFEQVTD